MFSTQAEGHQVKALAFSALPPPSNLAGGEVSPYLFFFLSALTNGRSCARLSFVSEGEARAR